MKNLCSGPHWLPAGGAVGARPEFRGPADQQMERHGGVARLNRRRRFVDYGIFGSNETW
jgi:hypothetical protein